MFNYLSKPPVVRASASVPGWDYIRHTFQNTILPKYIDFYSRAPHRLSSSHPLYNLIRNMNLPLGVDDDVFVDMATDKAGAVCSAIGMTHPVSPGRVWDGAFYNNRCKELIIGHAEHFDIETAARNWRTLQPVRVFRHDYSDLTLAPCTGDYPVMKNAFAVVLVNIPMLMLQYKMFYQEQLATREEGSIEDIATFLGRYPVTNMIYSHLDLCFWNRWCNYLYGRANDRANWRPPFHVANIDSRIESAYRALANLYVSRKPTFIEALATVPLVTATDMFSLVGIPKIALTRYVGWVFAVGLLPEMVYLVDIHAQFPDSANLSLINDMRIDLRRLTQDNIVRRYLTPDAYEAVSETLAHLQEGVL